MSLKYRPEIDGLRAVAVLMVILFHLQVQGFSGGYIGVDVFFVISGYLITSIIFKEYKQGDFTITSFYARRIRRIIPLSVFVCIFVLIGSYILFDADLYRTANHTVKFSLLFISNFLLSYKRAYFDPKMNENPLLHSWSLSVEEQFYIVFPLLLLLILRYANKRYKLWIALLAIGSFIVNILISGYNSQFAFYWPVTRAWELLCGAILALGIVPPISSKLIRDISSVAGLLLLLLPASLYNNLLAYPGWYAIVPVFGAALLIHTTDNKGIVNSILTARPIVFTGKISFSLYMWHWPLLVVTNYLLIDPLSVFGKMLLAGIIFIVAALSYKYIEQPFRTNAFTHTSKGVIGICAGALLVCISAFVFISNDGGLCGHEYKKYQQTSTYADTLWRRLKSTEPIMDNVSATWQPHLIGLQNTSPSFLVWGDSHARALAQGADVVAKENNRAGYIITASSCPPLTGVHFKDKISRMSWFNQGVLHFIKQHREIKVVVLAARWSSYYTKKNSGVQQMDFEQVLDTGNGRHFSQEQIFRYGLSETVKQLHAMGKLVVIVAPVPEMKCSVNEMLVIKKLFSNKSEDFCSTPATYQLQHQGVLEVLHNIKLNKGVIIFHPDILLLKNGYYTIAEHNDIFYRDDNHLSVKGAYLVAHKLFSIFP